MSAKAPELSAFLAKVLQLYVERQRELAAIRETVLLDYELDPSGAAKRGPLHAKAAERLDRSLNNTFQLLVGKALGDVPGVRAIVRDGDRIYVGLKPKVDA